MTKKSAAFWLDDVYFEDTTAPVAKLFDHLKRGHSIESFVKRYTAVDRGQVVDVLTRAGELFLRECEQAETTNTSLSLPGTRPTGASTAPLFDHLKQGHSIESFVKRYPALDHRQVVDVLTRAGELFRRECEQAEA